MDVGVPQSDRDSCLRCEHTEETARSFVEPNVPHKAGVPPRERSMPGLHHPNIFRCILENLYIAVYVVGRDGTILFWNRGAERITGYLWQEVIGRRARAIFWENSTGSKVIPMKRYRRFFAGAIACFPGSRRPRRHCRRRGNLRGKHIGRGLGPGSNQTGDLRMHRSGRRRTESSDDGVSPREQLRCSPSIRCLSPFCASR
jgi:PAS domain-containing protein